MPSTTRQALLQALSAAGGAYISGQQLAGRRSIPVYSGNIAVSCKET